MSLFVALCQIVLALGIVNVWIVRRSRPTEWRGGDAASLREEFRVYGLPAWFMTLVGGLKLLFAAALIVALWVPALTLPAAVGIAVLMLGAVAMHVKVGDPWRRSLPALTMLTLSLVVVVA